MVEALDFSARLFLFISIFIYFYLYLWEHFYSSLAWFWPDVGQIFVISKFLSSVSLILTHLKSFFTNQFFFFSISPSDKNFVCISPPSKINSFFFKSIIHYFKQILTLNRFIMSSPNKNYTLLFSIIVKEQVKNFPSISMSAAWILPKILQEPTPTAVPAYRLSTSRINLNYDTSTRIGLPTTLTLLCSEHLCLQMPESALCWC